MRANPRLTSGLNTYWIKFFVLAVFATMYVRDHFRPAFHKAIGVDPTQYDFDVFRITSEISRQTFPLTLDLDHPAFRKGFDRLFRIAEASAEAKARGGVGGRIKQLACTAAAALTFARLYLVPSKPNAMPAEIRLAPVW